MSEFIPQSDHLKPKLMSFYWGCNIKIEEQMSGLRSREEIVTESFMLISNQHQNNRATRYSHVLGGGGGGGAKGGTESVHSFVTFLCG